MKKLLFCLLMSFNLATQATTTIMCIGDSITYGATGNGVPAPGGYRDPLCQALHLCYQQVQFIGPNNGNSSNYLAQYGSAGHAGYPGYRIDELCTCLDGANPYPGNPGYWLTTMNFNPDVILLMAGTNDILEGLGSATAINHMQSMLIKLLALRPKASIVLAKIPPIFGTVAQQVSDFNNGLPALAHKFQLMGMKIQVADLQTPLLPFGAQFGDGVHPNGVTYDAMALFWLPEILIAIWQAA